MVSRLGYVNNIVHENGSKTLSSSAFDASSFLRPLLVVVVAAVVVVVVDVVASAVWQDVTTTCGPLVVSFFPPKNVDSALKCFYRNALTVRTRYITYTKTTIKFWTRHVCEKLVFMC